MMHLHEAPFPEDDELCRDQTLVIFEEMIQFLVSNGAIPDMPVLSYAQATADEVVGTVVILECRGARPEMAAPEELFRSGVTAGIVAIQTVSGYVVVVCEAAQAQQFVIGQLVRLPLAGPFDVL